MEFNYKIDDKQVKRLPEMARRQIWNELGLAMDMALGEVRKSVRRYTPRGATGHLKGGMEIDRIMSPGRIVGDVFPVQKYAEAVEKGTAAHEVPIDPLIHWVKRKLQLSGKMAVSRAWAIKTRIAGRARGKPGGTSMWALRTTGNWGYWMFKKAFNEQRRRVARIFELFMKRALRKYGS